HPAFGAALRRAQAAGVDILAYDCAVTPNTMVLDAPVPIIL
ncbi:MAG: DNA/RNA nuclease SfsA, partial [Oscillospiraceae bacterium]